MTVEPIKTVDCAGFTEVWYCDQPEVYRVKCDEWRNDYTERHIFEVEPVVHAHP